METDREVYNVIYEWVVLCYVSVLILFESLRFQCKLHPLLLVPPSSNVVSSLSFCCIELIFVDTILNPILLATEDDHIANMILKIMCECWLDHIYINKIKFTHFGAYQLLMDFEHVETWTNNNATITSQMKEKLLNNEVLRRCEGVGKLLLRMPGERIKMSDNISKVGE